MHQMLVGLHTVMSLVQLQLRGTAPSSSDGRANSKLTYGSLLMRFFVRFFMFSFASLLGKYVILSTIGTTQLFVGRVTQASPDRIELVDTVVSDGMQSRDARVDELAEAGPRSEDSFLCINESVFQVVEIDSLRFVESSNEPLYQSYCD